ncbi:hypothetical protein TEA_026931 [Camellia sinensis var. sinensis]|uniref:Uncharacterized protein n=1 Tax=Camellia sinensis var. sinensis TaxID=542762 RepID=A0A4S4E1L8_CAMSN|nr:hypothetical protein TEA_026931 [Camellia sinensis var. sinensis]
MSPDPCERPVIYFLDWVEEAEKGQTRTTYKRFEGESGKECGQKEFVPALSVQFVNVSAAKFDPGLWKKVDIRGDPYGLLAAQPAAPLVSLHHLDYVQPMFPGLTQIDSLNKLVQAYNLDLGRILQHCFCYDLNRNWSI